MYRKIRKMILENGEILEFNDFYEYALFDGNSLYIVNEEEMSINIRRIEDDNFSLVYSSEFGKNPLEPDNFFEFPMFDMGDMSNETISQQEEDENINDLKLTFDDEIEYNLELFDNVLNNLKYANIKENQFTSFDIKTEDGKLTKLFLGVEYVKNKIKPYLEIRKDGVLVLKLYINKYIMNKFFSSIKKLNKKIYKNIDVN